MRLLLLFLIPLVFAQPPIVNTMDFNNDMAVPLDDHYNPSIAKNSSLTVTFGNDTEKNFSFSVSMEIAGMNLLLDNLTYAEEGLSLILARGYEQEHLRAKPSEGYADFICDREWFDSGAQYAWRCDFDNDNCVEFENRTAVIYDLDVDFTFRNASEGVATPSNLIPVPDTVLEEMENSSGSEYLDVNVTGFVISEYEFNDREPGMADCGDVSINEYISVPFSLNASFLVAGQQKLFFLRSPILLEQWFRNNQFNVVVLSQSPLHYAELSINDGSPMNYTLKEFNTTNSSYGLRTIISNWTGPEGWAEHVNLTSPGPLQQEDHSYAFIYEFNKTYSGLGKNRLALFVEDSFSGEAEYEAILLSRALSYDGNNSETPVEPELMRKSASFEKNELTGLELSLGFVAVMLLLAFVNFWIK